MANNRKALLDRTVILKMAARPGHALEAKYGPNGQLLPATQELKMTVRDAIVGGYANEAGMLLQIFEQVDAAIEG